jgi:hypothetical protein
MVVRILASIYEEFNERNEKTYALMQLSKEECCPIVHGGSIAPS